MQVLGLFSGIGGFELGFRRAGFTIAGVCEIEPYACRVLAKHFPEARLYSDVKELTGERLRQDGIEPYVVTGGFPCQDISLAGKGAGLNGDRSGLWFEMHRVIAETRPRWVVAENVAALRSRGLDQVLGSLAAIGYDAEWHCIPASAVGAPHRRDRIWIVAYPNDAQQQRSNGSLANPGASREVGRSQGTDRGFRGDVGYPDQPRLEIRLDGHAGQQPAAIGTGSWQSEPDVGRVAHGIPARVDRLRALGNAVVPQIPEIIAQAIREYEFV